MHAINVLVSLMMVGDAPPLAVIQEAPNFTLTTQNNKELQLRNLRGKVLLVSFIFTTCSGSCPATTARMVQVQERLKDRGLLKRDSVRLLSITLDPARDTPAALARYLQLYDADPVSWSFLTGPREKVEKVITSWGMWAKPAPNGQLDHPSRIFLVDKQGRIREIYDLAFLKPAWVVEDMEALIKEAGALKEKKKAKEDPHAAPAALLRPMNNAPPQRRWFRKE